MSEIVCNKKIFEDQTSKHCKYLCFRHILHWFQQIFFFPDHSSNRWDGPWWITARSCTRQRRRNKKKVFNCQFCELSAHCPSWVGCAIAILLLFLRTRRHISTHSLIKQGHIMDNLIIMHTGGWITRLLYVVKKSSPFFAKCFFGFMLFIPHCKIDMKCLAQHFTLCMLFSRTILYFCWFTDVCRSEAHWEWVIPFLTLHTSLCLNSPTSQPLVNVGISILAFPLFVLFECVIHAVLQFKCMAGLCINVELRRDLSQFYSPS